MTGTIHTDWDTVAFDSQPVAAAVGPFSGRAMLRAWWRLRGAGELLLLEDSATLVPMYREDGTVRLVGEADLFDYHSPLGTDAGKLLSQWIPELPPGLELDFDSLPAEAADVFMNGLAAAGLAPVAAVHESAAVLSLTGDYDAYLAGLSKKQRHETRRKGRRFTETLGRPRLQRHRDFTAVTRFAAMHRLADGRKGLFMDEAMEEFFGLLVAEAGAFVDFLYGEGDEPVAAAFAFEDDHAYYLYNSAFDPAAAAGSPGIVLVSELVRQTAEAGIGRFDFLKGDEVYKYRLGATARPLWRVQATTGQVP